MNDTEQDVSGTESIILTCAAIINSQNFEICFAAKPARLTYWRSVVRVVVRVIVSGKRRARHLHDSTAGRNAEDRSTRALGKAAISRCALLVTSCTCP